MMINTLVCQFCTFLSKQLNILSLGYKWLHYLNCFPSASSRIDQINSDSLAAHISTVKRVKIHNCLTFDIYRLQHACRVNGRVGRCHFPMVSPNLHLSSAAFHLFESVRNPSSQWPIYLY